MEPINQSPEVEEVYSMWALPSELARGRLCRLMAGLRAAHGGPTFKPHVIVVGAIRLRWSVAVEALHHAASAGVRPYTANVVSDRQGFYRCGGLLLELTPEVNTIWNHLQGDDSERSLLRSLRL
ncbi:cyclic phosphodiesterase-like [Setaria viridis]|uniref:cyclic phosphodiesterase-like n=1 Tax=Setaria viridis TaxID=4556 RepID=UPI003B3A358D